MVEPDSLRVKVTNASNSSCSSFKHVATANSCSTTTVLQKQQPTFPSSAELQQALNFISGDELADRLQHDFIPQNCNDGSVLIVDQPGFASSLDMESRGSSSRVSSFSSCSRSPSPPSSPLEAPTSELCRPWKAASSPVGGVGRSGGLVLIDLRSMFLFQESHVRESINLTNCPLLSKRIQDGKLQIKEYLEARLVFDGSQDIVIYEQGPSDASEEQQQGAGGHWVNQEDSSVTEFARLIFKNLRKVTSKQARIEILKGGFDSFRRNYPNHCTQGVPFVTRYFISSVLADDESTYLNWEATEIRKNIFVGALHDAKNDELLDRLSITHILNCCKTASRGLASQVANKYKYRELQCDDNLQQSLAGKLEEAFQFIDDAVKSEGGKVLIHCYAGVSRSAAITIAYMMQAFNLTYQQSYRELKDKRSIVAPNINFVAQLMKYDDELRVTKQASSENVKPDTEIKATVQKETNAKPPTALMQKLERRSMQLPNLTLATKPKFEADGCSDIADGPAAVPATGLAAKRKMMLPLKISAGAPAAGKGMNKFDSIASAPIMPANYNPFCSAFKKANTTKNSFENSFSAANNVASTPEGVKSSSGAELFPAFPSKCSLGSVPLNTKANSIPE